MTVQTPVAQKMRPREETVSQVKRQSKGWKKVFARDLREDCCIQNI